MIFSLISSIACASNNDKLWEKYDTCVNRVKTLSQSKSSESTQYEVGVELYKCMLPLLNREHSLSSLKKVNNPIDFSTHKKPVIIFKPSVITDSDYSPDC